MELKGKRKPYLYEAILSFSFLIFVMAISIAKFEADPHVPMLIGTAFASIMATRFGYNWSEIEKGMFDGIYQALQAVVILIVIGILIGVWMESGVVPSMIYYGLGILSPNIFLLATLIICSVTSLATGTSWGAAGTVGTALMGIAKGLGIPAPIAAGAIISGVYFGDKLSPLSDTTNLAPAISGTDVFTHIKFMFSSTSIVYVITMILYLVIGLKYIGSATDMSSAVIIKDGLSSSFNISPLLLIPPLAVILTIAFKVPAIPGISIGILLGVICGFIFQGSSLGSILDSSYGGYVSQTNIEMIDELLTAGGLEGMMYSVSLTIIAMMFGGIMEATGQLQIIVDAILSKVRSATGLITMTVLTCIFSNVTMPEQYISIVVPGRMYADAYRKMDLHPKTLSNALESSGTLTSALIPWNTCGVFMSGVLGVSTLQYRKWAFFNYLMPLAAIILSVVGGITVAKIKDDPETVT
ncbi:MAG TPA: Na+/H+ antiporter NhaC [Tissierellaceae bacterium]|nr:Na+/H+ antiporter NhaC [Tissierellaceae bacterium]